MQFHDRTEAGQELAKALMRYARQPDTLVLGLPRGGIIVAAEVAKTLKLPLDIVVTRKIGAPGNSELAVGAIDDTGEGVFDQDLIKMMAISKAELKRLIQKTKEEIDRRLKVYRGNRPSLELKEKTVILVDDGVATGSTMQAAIHSAQKKGAVHIVVAVPVGAPDSLRQLKQQCDELFCLYTPENFGAVGRFYKQFDQTTDEEVKTCLNENVALK